MIELIESAKLTLNQLDSFLNHIQPSEYQQKLPLLSESTIGMHVRHIIEFYQCLIKGQLQGQINYDARERSLLQESNIEYARDCIDNLRIDIDMIQENKSIDLITEQNKIESKFVIESNLYRELSYIIEHTIHHFAIIKMACTIYFPAIQFDADFGIAYSTIKYRNRVYSHLSS